MWRTQPVTIFVVASKYIDTKVVAIHIYKVSIDKNEEETKILLVNTVSSVAMYDYLIMPYQIACDHVGDSEKGSSRHSYYIVVDKVK